MATNEFTTFENFLRTHGQKITKPRRTILEAFLSTEGHLSTEDILHEAKNEIHGSARQQYSEQSASFKMQALPEKPSTRMVCEPLSTL